jgi:hypothetical protein
MFGLLHAQSQQETNPSHSVSFSLSSPSLIYLRGHHRIHRGRIEIGGVYLPSQLSLNCNFVRDGK